jgi:ribosomal protein S18 acetylase RimI-like enzyme/ubiquinone/menaquinone biosynthesis C-methylase UbiE
MTAASTAFTTRRATATDAAGIAEAHRDSIAALGPRFYSADVVAEWGAGLTADVYVRAMNGGETFFVAESRGSPSQILGFATHRVDDGQHGTAVYVRGEAARRGLGSALYRLAEAEAIRAGACAIDIDASLVAVDFYKALGFVESGRGHHRLRSGALMACVFMRKALGQSTDDPTNGYEAAASRFIAARSVQIGVATVRTWGRTLPTGASILDVGCGHGVPIAQALVGDGFELYGVDASPTLAAAFRSRFPEAHVRCEPVESSRFFERTFDGVIAVGLLFLLGPETQADLIGRAAAALTPGGRLLFTSPSQPCRWTDALTGRESVSLGADTYKALCARAGVRILGEHEDEGENHYYDGVKR